MKKYIQQYMDSIKAFINTELRTASSARISEVLAEFETKILYFQHERLIHLIVTVLFAIMEIMAILTAAVYANLTAVILSVMFLILLVPYVMHYYFLENSVQEMYVLRDTIKASTEKQADKA